MKIDDGAPKHPQKVKSAPSLALLRYSGSSGSAVWEIAASHHFPFARVLLGSGQSWPGPFQASKHGVFPYQFPHPLTKPDSVKGEQSSDEPTA